jgi:hypothetical protein
MTQKPARCSRRCRSSSPRGDEWRGGRSTCSTDAIGGRGRHSVRVRCSCPLLSAAGIFEVFRVRAHRAGPAGGWGWGGRRAEDGPAARTVSDRAAASAAGPVTSLVRPDRSHDQGENRGGASVGTPSLAPRVPLLTWWGERHGNRKLESNPAETGLPAYRRPCRPRVPGASRGTRVTGARVARWGGRSGGFSVPPRTHPTIYRA